MEDDLKSEELNRLRAETAKLLAEREKIEIEKQSLLKEASRPWYRKERFIQAFVAGLLGFPILWFFFNEIIKPIYLSENVELQYRNRVARIEIGHQKTVLDSLRRKDSLSSIQLNAAWDVFQQRTSELEAEKEGLVKTYSETIEKLKEVTQERDRKIASLNKELKSIKPGVQNEKFTSRVNEIISKLDQSKSASNAEIKKLEKKFDSLTLKIDANASITLKDFLLEGEGISYIETPKNKTPFKEGLPDAIVFHFSASRSLVADSKWLSKDDVAASQHILIGKDGSIIQLVPLNTVAWHTGASTYNGRTGYNQLSIGIDFINAGNLTKTGDGVFRSAYGEVIDPANVIELPEEPGGKTRYWEKYTDEQISRAYKLCELLTKAYQIKEILGHSDLVPPGRKLDPGPAFPLKSLQDKFTKTAVP